MVREAKMPRQKMDLATVDLNTGDVKDGVFVYCQNQPRF